MPESHPETNGWILEKILEIQPNTVLDIGVGMGKIEKILRNAPKFPEKLDGIEIWEPYIKQYNLNARYTNIFNVDARQWNDWNYDLVVFGDVLEHMVEEESSVLWKRVSGQASYAIITIPIIHYPQGECYGNPYEIHHEDDWKSDRVLSVFPGITEYKEFSITGAYLAKFKDK